MRKEIVFYLNGAKKSIGNEHASMMLSDYLRYEQCLTGTKVVCAEGDCGACSVLKYSPIQNDSKTYLSFNSCVTPVATLDGSSIVTVDSLSADSNNLHEVQRSMVDCHGSQCGFCTPGFVMALTGLVDDKLQKSETQMNEQEAKNFMTGNLCRCTGYDAIIDSALAIDLNKCQRLENSYYSKEQDDELKKIINESVSIDLEDYKFYAPTTLQDACEYISKNDTVIIASSTDLGVVHNKRKTKLKDLLSLHLIKELYDISETDQRIRIGSRVTMHELRDYLKGSNEEFVSYIDVFASPQIKNIATIAGNIATASPIGDTAPVLLSLDARIKLVSTSGEREIALNEFFLDYRKTEMRDDELIESISFIKPKDDFLKSFKSSNRKDLDISTVNLSMFISKDKSAIRIAAGGIAAIPLRLKKTEDFLSNKKIDAKVINEAIDVLHTEFKPLSDVRGSASYRHMLIENYFKRAMSEFMEVSHV